MQILSSKPFCNDTFSDLSVQIAMKQTYHPNNHRQFDLEHVHRNHNRLQCCRSVQDLLRLTLSYLYHLVRSYLYLHRCSRNP